MHFINVSENICCCFYCGVGSAHSTSGNPLERSGGGLQSSNYSHRLKVRHSFKSEKNWSAGWGTTQGLCHRYRNGARHLLALRPLRSGLRRPLLLRLLLGGGGGLGSGKRTTAETGDRVCGGVMHRSCRSCKVMRGHAKLTPKVHPPTCESLPRVL